VVEEQWHSGVRRSGSDLLGDEGQQRGIGVPGEHAADERLPRLLPVRAREFRAERDQARHVEDGPRLLLLLGGHPRNGGDGGGLVDEHQAADARGGVLVDEAPPHGGAHRPAERVEPVEPQVVDEVQHVGGEARDAVAVVRLAGQPVPAEVHGDDTASGRKPPRLVAKHLLGLPPAVQHDQREALSAAVLVHQLHTVAGRQPVHGLHSDSSSRPAAAVRSAGSCPSGRRHGRLADIFVVCCPALAQHCPP
jgi:hypothetical protein